MAIRSYTVPELIAKVRLLANEPDDDRFDDSTILDFLNDAQDQFITETGALVSRETLANTVANQQEYPLPTSIQAITAVWFNDGSDWQRLSFYRYNLQATHYNETSSTPTGYYLRRNLIGLIPIPSDDGTNNIRIDCLVIPDELENSSDAEPFNGDEILKPYQNLLTYYAVAQMMASDSKADLADWWESRFWRGVAGAKKQLRSRNLDATAAKQFSEFGEGGRIIFCLDDTASISGGTVIQDFTP